LNTIVWYRIHCSLGDTIILSTYAPSATCTCRNYSFSPMDNPATYYSVYNEKTNND
jgi:hypothetical protein